MVKVAGKPKQGATSYALFIKTCREEHRKKFPNDSVNFADFSRRCADKWKTMTPKEKERFEQMAVRDKARYEAEMQKWTPPPGTTVTKGKKKKIKDPNAPKRPISAFFHFNAEERVKVKSEHPEWGIGEIGKELGRRWEGCHDKKKFEELAEKDRRRYEKQNAEYLKKKGQSPTKKQPAPQQSSDDDSD